MTPREIAMNANDPLIPTASPRRSAPLRLAPLWLCGALLAACGSTPPTAPPLAASAASLEAARAAGASELAPVELGEARSKIERARALAQAGKDREAVQLAEEADVDAQLARARAGTERSKRAVAEVQASLQTLREELRRRPVTAPGAMSPPARAQ